jgi:hypothetical protein
MSHIVNIQTEVRDAAALQAACERLRLPHPAHETVQLFSEQATGLTVRLPGWRYPVVCNLESGSVKYDNFGGVWGSEQELGRLLQSYAVCKTQIEARKQGHLVSEQPLADGSIRLVIQVTGGAA